MTTELIGEGDGEYSYDKQYAANYGKNDTTNASENVETVNKSFPSPASPTSAKPSGPKNYTGRRTYNPLSKFASYTYQISLYMITPDAYTAFVDSGRKNINALSQTTSNGTATNAGAFLIAQSGGINDRTKRAPGFELDYYIDNLKINSLIQGPETQTETNTTNINFSIYEPYGFSFISRLRQAMASLQNRSSIPNYSKAANELKQFYILGLRFQGYDTSGKLLTNTDVDLGNSQAGVTDSNGVFERFFDIIIDKMNFTLDGKMTTYKVEARSITPSVSYGVKRGRIKVNQSIMANNVYNALKGEGEGIRSLKGLLNAQEEENAKLGMKKNVYDFEFIGDSAAIQRATLNSKDKSRSGSSPIQNTDQSNDAASLKSVPELNKYTIQFKSDTSILQAISSIIRQSSYMEDAVRIIKESNLSDNSDDAEDEQNNKKPKESIKWYNVSTRVKCLEWDTKRNDFVYAITYVIQPYLTPAIISPYVDIGTSYYGPYKIYDYWFTGKNTEVIKYEQVLNNAYMQTVLDPSNDPASHGGDANISHVPDMHSNQPSQGAIDKGLDNQNSVLNSLFDVKNIAEAKVTILGDPDYLMVESAGSLSQAYNQFYGSDGFTINPNGGQVFMQINFKEGVDYKNSDGLLSINESLLFWKYPKNVENKIKDKGIHYRLTKVESEFSQGKFIQQIKGTLYYFPNAQNDKLSNARPNNPNTTPTDVRQPSDQSGSTDTSGSNDTSSGQTGLMPDSVPTPSSEIAVSGESSAINNSFSSTGDQQTTPQGVQNDDAYSAIKDQILIRQYGGGRE